MYKQNKTQNRKLVLTCNRDSLVATDDRKLYTFTCSISDLSDLRCLLLKKH